MSDRAVVRNTWAPAGAGVVRAAILSGADEPEGLDVERLRFEAPGEVERSGAPCLLGVIRGPLGLEVDGRRYALEGTTHAYIPPGCRVRLRGAANSEVVRVSADDPRQGRGEALLLRDERFLVGAAAPGQSLRWILTPQYLSRRIFLHHDRTLASASGRPVSWFRTTMFDVEGLPKNDNGEPVFKMTYATRTEFNVCYDVRGEARVRVAKHPCRDRRFGPWLALDADSTYHLRERSEDADPDGLRNRHEVFVGAGGHVTLFCLFDPAPTGVERHRPGEYSDYEPIEAVVARPEYARHRRECAAFDRAIDALSLALAEGRLDALVGGEDWARIAAGQRAQVELERATLLEATRLGRADVLRPYLTQVEGAETG